MKNMTGKSVHKQNVPTDTETSCTHPQSILPDESSQPIIFKVATFNVWGIPFISPYRKERVQAIRKELAELDPDFVGFQECWLKKDREQLVRQLNETRLRYNSYYRSGFGGSGLFILSAFPILDTQFWRYTKNGKWYKPWHGDWWGGKGVALARMELPTGQGMVNLFNTHIITKYNKTMN